MKRINFAGTSLMTGNAVADALLNFATHLDSSVTVDIPVLESNGVVEPHTLLLGPATQLSVVDADGVQPNEAELFPVPEFPPVGGIAVAKPAARAGELSLDIDEDPYAVAG